MSRPQKCRRIGFLPDARYFKPSGIPLTKLETIVLSMEEAEALRLKDLEGMEQEPASRQMNVSRPTFQRILASARYKISDAILNGKAVRISGGNVEIAFSRFRCHQGHQWDIPDEKTSDTEDDVCPTCHSHGQRAVLPRKTVENDDVM